MQCSSPRRGTHYEWTEARRDTAGSYRRKLWTQAGEVELKMLRDSDHRALRAAGRHCGDACVTRTVSNLNKKVYAAIEAWRTRPIEGEHA